MTVSPSVSGKFIHVNVGGTVFKTTAATLQGGSSMLSKMFSGDMEPGLRDEQGHVYIDRDPKHFGVILNCLRCGGGPEAAAKLLPAGRAEQLELQLEAQYYGCEGLVAALEEAEEQWEHRQACEQRRVEAAAAIDSSRAALLQEADDKQAEAEEALQEAHAELAELGRQAQQIAASLAGAPEEERRDRLLASVQMWPTLKAARDRGVRAARQRLRAQLLRLAALGGGAERAAGALWRQQKLKAVQELRQLHDAHSNALRRAFVGDPDMPDLVQDPSDVEDGDSDGDDPWGGDDADAGQGHGRRRRRAPRGPVHAGDVDEPPALEDDPSDEEVELPALNDDASDEEEDDGPPALVENP